MSAMKEGSRSIKGQISSVNRAVRSLKKALGEAQVAKDAARGAPDRAEFAEALAAASRLINKEILNVEDLFQKFEDAIAESEEASDAHQAEIDVWETELFAAKKLEAEVSQLLQPPPILPRSPSLPPPANDQDQQGGDQSFSQPSTSNAESSLVSQVSRMLSLIEAQQSQGPASTSQSPSSGSQAPGSATPLHTRLPKLEMPKFEGDILKWRTFWDRFEACVDQNDRLPPVEKLSYLIGSLDKEPKAIVETLELSNKSYDTAKAMLQKKYGNTKLVVAMLYRKLSELKPVKNDPLSLRRFAVELDGLLESLGNLGQDTNDDSFAALILSKLPPPVFVMLEMSKDVDQEWTVPLVRKTLADHLVRMERTAKMSAMPKGGASAFEFTADMLLAGEKPKSGPKNGKKKGPDQGGGGNSGGSKGPAKGPSKGQGQHKNPPAPPPGGKHPYCAFCEGNHYPDKCTKYTTSDERFKRVGDRCRVCFNPNHIKKDCKSTRPCHYCRAVGSHNSALCFKQFGRGGDHAHASHEDPPDSDRSPDPNDDDGSALLACGEAVALQTAKIPIQAGSEDSQTYVVTRGFFDIGSNRTYCSKHLARKVRMKTRRGPSLKINRFGADGPVSVPTETGTLCLRKLDGSVEKIEVSVIPKITGNLTRVPVHSPRLDQLRSRVHLADEVPRKYEQTPIDLLIGNDYYLDFIKSDKIPLEKGLYLLGSEFGYILSGRTALPTRGGYSMAMCGFTCGAIDGLDDVVAIPKAEDLPFKKPVMSDFLSLDGIGIQDEPEASSDELAVQDFKKNVRFEEGRYYVSLPKNDRVGDLSSNYKLSLGRLNSLTTKRLSNDPDLLEAYDGIIKDQLAKGVIEKVNRKVPVSKTHYIPHHAVVTPQKETTKVRIVYDGSAKVRKDSPSLNECLHRGPVLLEDLVGLLMRFRLHKFGMIADIEKAFLQIGIDPKDRDLLRFLWLKDPKREASDDNLEVYRFCRVLFGLNCSPSLLLQTVNHHLELVGTQVAKQVKANLYADNVITGVSSLEEGKRFYTEAKGMFKEASMNLRQWTTNLPGFMDQIPPEDRMKSANPKVLGLQWDQKKDQLSVPVGQQLKEEAHTKRKFLSQLSSVFDPLGLYTPVTIPGKILLQKACQSKPDWDTDLPPAAIEGWDDQRKRLLEVPKYPAPRFIPNRGTCTLVGFCDASNTSFATALYLRCQIGQQVYVNLLMSKSRLNPVKRLTIPRMELMGILIGVRGIKFVAQQLKISVQDIIIFSDSTCALAWLQSQKKQDVFVRNRVKEIVKKSKGLAFRYVQTDHNPADWATRGKTAAELSEFWWSGPRFLKKPKPDWPDWNFPEVVPQEDEPSPCALHEASLVAESDPTPVLEIEIEKFSSHLKLIRVTAWCLRFIDRLKKKPSQGSCLTAEELAEAQGRWEKHVQLAEYDSVFTTLGQKPEYQMGQLCVFKDSKGLLRSKGRLEKANLQWETKYPKLLPKHHPYTRLLIDRFHRSNGHASVLHTHNRVRREYWVPKGRQLVKSVIHKCVVCKKAAGRSFARPPMPELPSDRVVPQPCFTSTGVDYFGPLKVRGADKVEKAWVALFTCLTTRAIHLELVQDLSASEFLMALRRFIARRGKPSAIISDNAPQFKAVAKTAQVTWNRVVQDPSVLNFASKEGIKWSFIVEYAPYMGGVYERLVGIVKTCLRKTIGTALLTPKQFETLLCESKAIVNTRPLTYVGSDFEDGFVLTPAHFLSLNPQIAVPDFSAKLRSTNDLQMFESPTLEALVDGWKKGQNLLTEFWHIWQEDYLNALRERLTYRHHSNQGTLALPKIGDVVLMKELGLPRGSWKLAKISQVHSGADGRIRSASVKLPSGRELRRPVNLLVPLEVVSSQPDAGTEKDSQQQDKQESSKGATPRAPQPGQDLVLAKLPYYQKWPAKVLVDCSQTPLQGMKVPKDTVPVQFFKTNKFAFVPKTGIFKFDPSLRADCKRKDLQEAYDLASQFGGVTQ